MSGNRASAYRAICSAVGWGDDSSLKTGLPILRQKCTQSNRLPRIPLCSHRGRSQNIATKNFLPPWLVGLLSFFVVYIEICIMGSRFPKRISQWFVNVSCGIKFYEELALCRSYTSFALSLYADGVMALSQRFQEYAPNLALMMLCENNSVVGRARNHRSLHTGCVQNNRYIIWAGRPTGRAKVLKPPTVWIRVPPRLPNTY